jgi:hypothetical protein
MFQRLVLSAVLVAAVLGCGKKKTVEDTGAGSGGGPSAGSGGGSGAGSGEDSGEDSGGDPNATYTIKLRELKAGDKVQQSLTGTTTRTTSYEPKGTIEPEEVREKRRYEYVEEILERKAGEQATRARRVYKTAERTENGKKLTEVFQNKTVLIDKQPGGYRFRIEGGGPITGPDAKHLERSFNDDPHTSNQEMLPDRPVKLNETWSIDKEVIAREFAGDRHAFTVDLEKTTATGKLTRVYRKGGQQFGVIQLRLNLPVKDLKFQSGAKLKPGARMTADLTLDTCIDGSVSDNEAKARFTFEFAATLPSKKGGATEMRMVGDATEEESEKQIASVSPADTETGGAKASSPRRK